MKIRKGAICRYTGALGLEVLDRRYVFAPEGQRHPPPQPSSKAPASSFLHTSWREVHSQV